MTIITLLGFFVGLPSIYGYVTFVRFLIMQWKRNRSKSIILKNKKDWIVVTPRYEHSFQRKEDMMAAIQIRDWCQSLGVKCTIQDDQEPIPTDKDIFFICGPKANKRVSQYYKGLEFELEKDGDAYVIADKRNEQKFHSKMDVTTEEKLDYAILSRIVDKNIGRYCIFCMGIKGQGTLGAAHMLTTGLINNISKDVKQREVFESVVSVPYIDEYCSIANVLFAVPPRV